MRFFKDLGFDERAGALSRPIVHVPYPVFKFCKEHDLPLNMLYAIIRFKQITGLPESLQAITTFLRWYIENPKETTLTRMDIAEMGNFLQLAVDLNLPVEENAHLTFDASSTENNKKKISPKQADQFRKTWSKLDA